eukprot:6382696-Pyramimonas_sp.AAC.1
MYRQQSKHNKSLDPQSSSVGVSMMPLPLLLDSVSAAAVAVVAAALFATAVSYDAGFALGCSS